MGDASVVIRWAKRCRCVPSWLEDPYRQRVLLLFAQCLAQRQGIEAADTFIAQLGWLPLQEQWEAEKRKG